jgi:hypothetical protein
MVRALLSALVLIKMVKKLRGLPGRNHVNIAQMKMIMIGVWRKINDKNNMGCSDGIFIAA